MVEVRKLSCGYTPKSKVLHDVDITFDFERQGHIVAILGHSGSGKTTLLKCLSRFLRPHRGAVRLDKKDIWAMDERSFRGRMGVVFQALYLFPHLTVQENLVLALTRVQGEGRDAAGRKAHAALDKLGIEDLAESYPAQLSGGQAQRAAIARSLVLEPRYLLLDEPTAALDMNTTADFAAWLQDLGHQTNFIIVTHDIEFTRQTAAFGILLEDGRVKETGDIEQLVEAFGRTDKDNGEIARK
ncbi:MAG: ATP-binding cassette domain-containing protein [Chitinivibrionales bacterium]|nr:ATP-binding cassette domain-containing protein [Chitinivibrionales bacterium]MBD3356015.1 ATP-binding cassette domain-containing protein [Chitinivibrionales bacterium]